MLAQAKTAEAVQRGENIILGGLGIQVVFFAFFMVAIIIFDLRIRAKPTPLLLSLHVPWRGLIWVLYTSSLLIMIRSVFRVAQYAQGRDGALQSLELYVYIFDSSMMIIVAALFNWFHPDRVLSRHARSLAISSSDVLDGESYMLGDSPTRPSLSRTADGKPVAIQV